MVRDYVVTNSIRHLDELYSSKFVRFSISNFERSVLLCIEADLRDQIRVGKRLTRSTCVRVYVFLTVLQRLISRSQRLILIAHLVNYVNASIPKD